MTSGRILRLATGAMLVAVLGACGGGGGGGDPLTTTTPVTTTTPTAASIDPYVGAWRICWPLGTDSEREVLTITKTSDTTGNFSTTLATHAGAGCTGAVIGSTSGSGSGSLAWKGTKPVGTETVDKIEILMGGQTEKQIVIVRADGKLYAGIPAGEPGSTVDAEGYPGTLQAVGFTKLP